MKLDGGVGSVRVVPLGMKEGGDPAEKLLAEGPPNQFTLRQEEKVIPSEPNVLTKPNRDTASIFSIPDPKFDYPMSSEPKMSDKNAGLMEGERLKDVMIMGPVIDPREVYPRDPDPFIQGFFDPMPQDRGGIPNLMDANMLKPAGILTINKSYDI
tara:strand:- start:21 stop:485 length:465 start_codon:yes stop_codon:yes gene_type:complete